MKTFSRNIASSVSGILPVVNVVAVVVCVPMGAP